MHTRKFDENTISARFASEMDFVHATAGDSSVLVFLTFVKHLCQLPLLLIYVCYIISVTPSRAFLENCSRKVPTHPGVISLMSTAAHPGAFCSAHSC